VSTEITEIMTDAELWSAYEAGMVVRAAEIKAEEAAEAEEWARRHVVPEVPVDDMTDAEFWSVYEAGVAARAAEERAEKRAAEDARSAAAAQVRWSYRRDVELHTKCKIVDAGDEVTLRTPRFHPGLARAAKGLYGYWRPAASGRGGVWVFERSYVDRVYSLAETFYR
jgi:hypothetical protein